MDMRKHVRDTLDMHRTELRQRGVKRLSIFGSVARGDMVADSDLDFACLPLHPLAFGMTDAGHLREWLEDLFGKSVYLVVEPSKRRSRLQEQIDKYRYVAFE